MTWPSRATSPHGGRRRSIPGWRCGMNRCQVSGATCQLSGVSGQLREKSPAAR